MPQLLVNKILEKGDEILITELEHHSNYVPWHYLRENKGAVIKFAPINDDGDIIISELEKLITSKTKIIAITHLIKCYWNNSSSKRNYRYSS